MGEEMTSEELKVVTIEQYVNVMRIKKDLGETVSHEVEYQLSVLEAKLNALGISTENLALPN